MNIKKMSLLAIMLFSHIHIFYAAAGEEKESDRSVSKATKFNDPIVTADTSFDELYPLLASEFAMVGANFNDFMRTRLEGHHLYDIVINKDGQSSTVLHDAIVEAEHFFARTMSTLLQQAFDRAIKMQTDLTPDEINLLQYVDEIQKHLGQKMLLQCFRAVFVNQSFLSAVREENIDIARRLLERGADINHISILGSALHSAAFNNDAKMAKFLIESGINVNLKDSYGWTAIFWPCTTAFKQGKEKSRLEIVKLMILNGVNLDDKVNRDRQTLLSWAIENKHPNIISILIDKGVDVNFENLQSSTALPGLLIMAIRSNNLQIVNLLIQAKVNINARDDKGFTALIYASQLGYAEIVDRLLTAEVDINVQISEGSTALMRASKFNHIEIVQKLIAAGAHVNTQTNTGHTALMIASQFNHVEIVQMLIAAGATINIQTNTGHTALIIASQFNHVQIVQMLITAGANINIQTNKGSTALMRASEFNHIEIAQMLIDAGADINIKNNRDNTAFDIASEAIKSIIEQAIKQRGA